jgi:hypothetical protein
MRKIGTRERNDLVKHRPAMVMQGVSHVDSRSTRNPQAGGLPRPETQPC